MLKFCEFSINYHTLKIIKLKASELFHKNSSISMLQNPTLLVLNFQARLWLRIKLNCRLVHRSEVNMIEFTFEMEYTAYIVVNLPQIDEEKKKFKRICRRGKKKIWIYSMKIYITKQSQHFLQRLNSNWI